MELKQLTINQLEEAVRLADLVFRDEEQISMGKAFPQIFHPPLESHSFGIYEDGLLLSFMGLVPHLIRIGDARVTAFSLGSVATHPSYRGKGYASRLLTEVISYVTSAGASLLLVSGLLPLYRRAGCHPFGEIRGFHLTSEHLPLLSSAVPPYSIRKRESKDILPMSILAADRKVAYEQSPYDLMLLIEQESLASCEKRKHLVWVAEGKEGMAGYLITAIPYDRGAQKQLALEWAGDPPAVTALLAHALRQNPELPLEIPVPFHEEELISRLSPFPSARLENQGTVKILNAPLLRRQLEPYLLTLPAKEKDLLHALFQHRGEWDEVKVKELFRHLPFPFTAGLNYI